MPTVAEAEAFKERRAGQRDPKMAKAAGVPDGGERHEYKTAGEAKLPLYV